MFSKLITCTNFNRIRSLHKTYNQLSYSSVLTSIKYDKDIQMNTMKEFKRFNSSLLNKNHIIASHSYSYHNDSSQKQPDEDVERKYTKLHAENENATLHKIMINIPELKDSLAPIFNKENIRKSEIISQEELETILKIDFNKNNDSFKPSDIIEYFTKITYYMYDKEDSITHNKFDSITTALIQSVQGMTEAELCKILYLLQLWSAKCFRKDRNFYEIFIKIDEELIKRLFSSTMYFNVTQLLLLVDFWSNLNLINSSNFCKLAIRKLLLKSHQLSSKNFVQLMFYQCKFRFLHPAVSSYDLEFNFIKKFENLTSKEIAIVCLAFFKSEKKFQTPNLCLKIAKQFLENFSELDSICLNAYLKSMRYWFPSNRWNDIYDVCDKLYQHCDNLPYHIIPHAALLSANSDVYHSKLIDKLVEKTIENIKEVRIKDLEKLLLVLGLFDHKPKNPEIFEMIVNEFLSEERQKEISTHPKVLPCIVAHLITHNIYNIELIEKVLSEEYLEHAFGKNQTGFVIPRHLLTIDYSIDIECPDYNGPRLLETVKHKLCHHYAWRKPGELFKGKIPQHDTFVLELSKTLEKMFGSKKYFHLAYVLPHFIKPEWLICIDKNGKPVPIPESMSELVYVNPFPPPNIGTWYAIICLPFGTMIKNVPNKMKGTYLFKKRQLEALGYKTILIRAIDWHNETDETRENILKEHIVELQTNSVSTEQVGQTTL